MSLTYFAENNSGNEQLWITDGTVAGTRMVRAFAGNPIFNLTVIGARVYFTVDDGVSGPELWTSDGTTAGTVMVADINPGSGGSLPLDQTNVNGTLFFSASEPLHGKELWESNGTSAGTMLVKDITSGPTPSLTVGTIQVFADVNGTLFFDASDGANGFELWKSDGTAAGTVLVKDVNPGVGSSFPQYLTSANGTLFFVADDGSHGDELWKSDGTPAGTVLVKDVNPGPGNGIQFGGFSPVSANVSGTLFFAATDGSHGVELWKSDGTAAGTVMVKDIDPGALGSSLTNLTNVNGTLFFSANDGTHGAELWKSDGTDAGTVMVKDINPGVGDSIAPIPGSLVNVGGTLFFAASDGAHGGELWKSDGTAAGTVMVADIRPGIFSSFPRQLTNVNGVLEFVADDGTSLSLFRSDGTAAGTFKIASNVDNIALGFTPPPVVNDSGGDRMSDILWRNTAGGLSGWAMNGGSITSGSLVTSTGVAVAPDASWSVAGISDFNGDGAADVLWRATDGTLADWTMNGNVIASSGVLSLGGVAVKPDASWSIVGTGDFDGDSRSDILWRGASGQVTEWLMHGSTIIGSSDVTSAGATVSPDASWSVAGTGDFNGDGRSDILWRNSSGQIVDWLMNGSTISNSGDLTSGGVAVRPDASWSIAGIGDLNHDGASDILWRNTNGSLAEWLMNGSTIIGSGAITAGGAVVTPDATWHVVEIGDFNGDSNSDILWRNDNGSMAEWLMNGTSIVQSLTPNVSGTAVSPDATWSPQAKPTVG